MGGGGGGGGVGFAVYEEETLNCKANPIPSGHILPVMMTMPWRMSLCSETVITQLLPPLLALRLHVMTVTHFTIQIVFSVVGT